jgi:hypothetical protein
MTDRYFRKLLTFLKKLDQAHLYYTLAAHREDAIMVLVTVPGERWEIEFLGDGSIEVERFLSNGEIFGEEVLNEMFSKYADPDPSKAV